MTHIMSQGDIKYLSPLKPNIVNEALRYFIYHIYISTELRMYLSSHPIIFYF